MSKRILGIIPARGGSKGIKMKNIVSLGGVPLISYTIKEALKAKHINYLCLSTENEKIAKIASSFNCPNIIKRDSVLASDKARTFDVVVDCLGKMEELYKVEFDLIILLQPTVPFRSYKDIDLALETLIKRENDSSLISVVRVLSHHPMVMKKIKNGYLENYCLNEPEGMRRQDYAPHAYMRNGAIYACWKSTIIKFKSLYGPKIIPFKMPEERSINIDGYTYLALSETMLNQKKCVE